MFRPHESYGSPIAAQAITRRTNSERVWAAAHCGWCQRRRGRINPRSEAPKLVEAVRERLRGQSRCFQPHGVLSLPTKTSNFNKMWILNDADSKDRIP